MRDWNADIEAWQRKLQELRDEARDLRSTGAHHAERVAHERVAKVEEHIRLLREIAGR